MTFYRVNKRYYTKSDGNESHEYYVMPYDLIGTIGAVGFWAVLMDFCASRAFFVEDMAKHHAKYHSHF